MGLFEKTRKNNHLLLKAKALDTKVASCLEVLLVGPDYVAWQQAKFSAWKPQLLIPIDSFLSGIEKQKKNQGPSSFPWLLEAAI